MSAMPVSFSQGFVQDPVHLRHDLMIEIGRIDMALDDVRRRSPANQPDVEQSLEKRRASLNDALTRLMA